MAETSTANSLIQRCPTVSSATSGLTRCPNPVVNYILYNTDNAGLIWTVDV